MSGESLISDVGRQRTSCGYCKTKHEESSISHGMIARRLTVSDYQDLIDLGWRRSGTYLYKPDAQKTCCPPYTIRLPANEFVPDRDQARMLRKLGRYLAGQGPALKATGQGPGTNTTDHEMADEQEPSKADTATGIQQQQQQQQREQVSQQQQDSELQQRPVPPSQQASQQGTAATPTSTSTPTPMPAEPTRLHAVQVRAALTIVLSAAVEALQTLGVLPVQIVLPQLIVTPRSAGKQRHKGSTEPHAHLPSGTATASAAQSGRPGITAAAGPSNQPHPVTASTAAVGVGMGARASDGQMASVESTAHHQRPHKRSSRESSASLTSGPEPPSLELSSPCCFALAAAAQRASQSAAQGTQTTPDSQHASNGNPGPPAPARCSPSDLASYMQQVLAGILQGLTDLEAATDAGGGQPTISPQSSANYTQAIAAAISNAKARLETLASSPEGRDPPSINHSGLLLQTLSSVLVEAANGYLNFTCPVMARPQLASEDATTTPHRSPPHKLPKLGGGGAEGLGSSRLEVVMMPSQFIEEEFQLYKRYQIDQHKDEPEEVTREAYTRFLVESPLVPLPLPSSAHPASASPGAVTPALANAVAAVTATHTTEMPAAGAAAPAVAAGSAHGSSSVPACGYGSFHMQYRIDGVLIAVGVVDVLPRCLSSVYLFWDPDARSLGLGKMTALYELLWVQQASKVCPDLRWLYMGFYIHSCHKMRYKAEYRPSDLLCPTNKLWVRISPPVLSALEAAHAPTISKLHGQVVFRNHAHSVQEAAAAAAAVGHRLVPSSDVLQPVLAGTGQDSEQPPVTEQPHAPSNAPSAAALPDVRLLVWKQVARWKALRNQLTAASIQMVESSLEEWLPLVGSLGTRLIYQLT